MAARKKYNDGKPRKLQPMQVKFKEAYLAQPPGEKNPTKAAIAAGYAVKTASEQGRRLMIHPRMRAELMRDRPEEVSEIAKIDAAWVLHELAALWEIPLTSLLTDDGMLRPLNEIPEQAQKLIASFEVTQHVDRNGDGTVETVTRVGKVKLHDRLRVLEDIGKLTKINAFGTGSMADAADSVADLMRAATKLASRSIPNQPKLVSGDDE